MTAPLERILEAVDPTQPNPDRPRESVTDPASLTGRIEKVRGAFRTAYPYEEGADDWWIQDVYETFVIAEHGGEAFRIPFTISEAGAVTFADAEKVATTVTYAPVAAGSADDVTESLTSPNGTGPTGSTILESLDEEGSVWRVTMIRPGLSKNGRRYTKEVLAEAAHLYEGVKAFDGHRSDENRRMSPVGAMVGWHENVTVAADGSLQSDFHIAESAPHIKALFRSAWKAGRTDLIGFSHDAQAWSEKTIEGGRQIKRVRQIAEVHSVDVVADPSAGGKMERLVASIQDPETGENMDPREFLRRLKAGELTEAQIAEAVAANEALEPVLEAFRTVAPTAPDAPEPVVESTDPQPERTLEAGELPMALRRATLREEAAEHNLPKAAIDRIAESLETLTTEEAIVGRVKETADLWSAIAASQPASLPGQHAVTVTEAEADKFQKALDGMIGGRNVDGVPMFSGLKEAYATFTGDHGSGYGDSEDYNRRILASMVGAVSSPTARLTESLQTGSWSEALGDSIRRRLINQYMSPAYSSWRDIVSDIVPRTDFRTNRLVRVGGYDTLPVVPEGAAYQPLTSPTDEEATYAITKKGGTEDYTLEMVANDDLRALRRIPDALARAAALTLYLAIWDGIFATNPTIYDSVALFDAAHNNTAGSSGLAEATIAARRKAMVQQTALGEASGYVGIMPKFLAVPSDLYVEAFKLTQSQVSVVGSGDPDTGAPNPWRGLVPIEVPIWTDANDWFLIADPQTCPTIEVGFYQGRQDPELFVQDQPTVGSVFTADKFTWKIRHIWGLAVEDYRGFQRGQG